MNKARQYSYGSVNIGAMSTVLQALWQIHYYQFCHGLLAIVGLSGYRRLFLYYIE